MELQNEETLPQPSSTTEVQGADLPARPRAAAPTTSGPTLRFPKPHGSKRLANWLANSDPGLLQQPVNMSDTSDLGGSCYEFVDSVINTDTESQDGQATDYTSDVDGPRMDDVRSLGDESEQLYESDSEEDEPADATPHDTSIQYADRSLQEPSTNVPVDNLQLGVSASSEGSSLSIEFQEMEVDPQYRDNISVIHTIREFSEEETKMIAEAMYIPAPPKYVAATIRQTMLQDCLETHEPLRIFYVGSQSAERDILSKISSAIYASSDGFPNTEGMYNIHQMDNFLSSENPHVEIFPLSPYSIKVDRCKSAQVFPEGDTKICSITLDKDRTYILHSETDHIAVEPELSLPHIAIFYCTEFDDESIKTTRRAAAKFMKLRGVPSIFISDAQSFTRPVSKWWQENLDIRAVHMCLESRDPEIPTEPYRLPIDVASFLNIDARQMNRNLACLTGLGKRKEQNATSDVQPRELLEMAGRKLKSLGFPSKTQVEQVATSRWFTVLVVPLLLSLLARCVLGPSYNWTLVDQRGQSGQPLAIASTSGTATTTKVIPTTTTVVINVTSTKTVKVSQVEPAASSLASSALSFAGLISAPTPTTEAEPKKTLCSVEVLPTSKNEILVKLPPGSKAAWLAKGAIDIDVRRGEEAVKSRLSSTDEGILVEIKKQDAWGVLNVSVITTRRPKINETFEINFGRPVVMKAVEAGLHMLQDVIKEVAGTADKAAQTAEDNAAASWGTLRDKTMTLMDSMFGAARSAQQLGSQVASDAVHRVKHSFTKDDLSKIFENAHEQVLSAEEDLNLSILQAQIASKLWWLKFQGKEQEYEEYHRKGTAYVTRKKAELQQTRKAHEEEAGTQDEKSCGSTSRRKCRHGPKKDRSHKLRVWRKMITG